MPAQTAPGYGPGLPAPGPIESQVEAWQREGRTLVAHLPGYPPPFTRGEQRAAEREADEFKLSGAVRLLFIKERMEGWIGNGQFENVTQQGLLDELITPLTLGLVHGPGPSTTRATVDPKTGRLKTENVAGATEQSENALSEALTGPIGWIKQLIGIYGLRLGEILGGAALILFGLYTLAKGEPPKLSAAPIPIPI